MAKKKAQVAREPISDSVHKRESGWSENRLKGARRKAAHWMEVLAECVAAKDTEELDVTITAFITNRDVRILGVHEAAVASDGAGTPGVDRQCNLSAQAQRELATTLWHAPQWAPRRVVWVTNEEGKRRKLSIGTIRDRAREHILLRALIAILDRRRDPAHYCVRHRGELAAYADAARYLNAHGPCGAVVADIKGYFDNINVPLMLTRLELPSSLESMVRSAIYPTLLGQAQADMVRELQRGIPQGSPISAELACHYLNGITDALRDAAEEHSETPPFVAVYVDNILLMHPESAALDACASALYDFMRQRGLELGSVVVAGSDMRLMSNRGIEYMAATFHHYPRPPELGGPDDDVETYLTIRAAKTWEATRSRIRSLGAAVPPEVLLADDTYLLGSFEGNNYDRLYPGFREAQATTLADAICLPTVSQLGLVFGPGWPT